ncbi:MAG: hypothetical protein AB1726_14800 [Planctomycetota bacterium]
MTTPTLRTARLAIPLALAALVAAPGGADPADPALAPGAPGEIATLLVNDDLLCTFDFRGGGPGARIVEGEVVLDGAQIVFHAMLADRISYGFVRNELVRVLDLGDFFVPGLERAQDPAPKYPVSLFHTLRLEDSHFVYQGAGGRQHSCDAADRILAPLGEEGIEHLEPKVGHTYLLRAERRGEPRPGLLVKLQVVDFQPGHSLTLRWARVGE